MEFIPLTILNTDLCSEINTELDSLLHQGILAKFRHIDHEYLKYLGRTPRRVFDGYLADFGKINYRWSQNK